MRHRIALSVLIAALASGCEKEDPSRFQGYVEGEYVRIGAPIGGRLQTLSVARGATVTAGTPLFALEPAPEQQAVADAQARVQWADAQLKRNEELRGKGWV